VSAPFQIMPALSDEDRRALKADIQARGVQVPVEYDDEENILDGHHRVAICAELGITDWPRVIRKGLSEAEKRSHARALNLARRHVSHAQRRELIAEQLKETPRC
jgi:ParB-like chromosome segregation protein Spo0J